MSGRLILSTATPGTRDGLAQAATVGVAAAHGGERPALLVALEREPRRRPATLLASPAARELERALRDAGVSAAVARGHICLASLADEPESLDSIELLAGAHEGVTIAHLPAPMWERGLGPHCSAGLLRAELPRDRALAALVVGELRDRGLRARVATRALGRVAARRALAGVEPGGVAASRGRRLARGLLAEDGQSLPAMLGALAAVMICTLALVAIVGAVTGKGRAQRAADLAAISAARSMRDDTGRLSAPARFANGAPNPRHLSKPAFLARAGDAAKRVAAANGVAAPRVEVVIPDAGAVIPIRARVVVRGEVDRAESDGQVIPVVARATAEASPPAGSWTGMPATASGGGYSGPLAYRQGKPMRPDVAVAFDQMAAAARRAGYTLTVTSGFRSDAEQAALFAAHPDPTWVAPPGHSLHRCATELDLGPSSAYGWLAAHAQSFGFLKRYSWEPWHFGFENGPPPCSQAGNSIGSQGAAGLGNDGAGGGAGVPEFVPSRYRAMLVRAAGRWNVSAALLAAQIMAESGFNPNAVSPAGAQGIAQFMPGTAASYGLRDPFDPEAAINAQAHLMSDLLRQLKSIPLALAAYNAGPGAVSACHCIPYAETRAYVTRILALMNGSGALLTPPLEVRLVD
jgi:hypothetical protein